MPTPFQTLGMPNAPAAGERTKPIQRGAAIVSGTSATTNITIAAVNMSKTTLNLTGWNTYGASTYNFGVKLTLTSPTNIQAVCVGTGGGEQTQFGWEVVEKY